MQLENMNESLCESPMTLSLLVNPPLPTPRASDQQSRPNSLYREWYEAIVAGMRNQNARRSPRLARPISVQPRTGQAEWT